MAVSRGCSKSSCCLMACYVFRLLLCLPYADYHWDCTVSLSRSIHKGIVSYLVLLHLESVLSLYDMISLQPLCMIRVTRPVLFISFLDYWQVTLIWSPYGDASLICSLLIGDTSTTYYTDVAIRVMMTLY